jgi:hypothetical protein
MATLESILGALVPMVVTFLLGFVAAWRRVFGIVGVPHQYVIRKASLRCVTDMRNHIP